MQQLAQEKGNSKKCKLKINTNRKVMTIGTNQNKNMTRSVMASTTNQKKNMKRKVMVASVNQGKNTKRG
jgi:hypothetical protein